MSGCFGCGGDVTVSGRVRLAVDVDLSRYGTLELRGYEALDHGEPASTIPSFRGSIRVGRFPIDYVLYEEEPTGGVVHMHAWLTMDATVPGARRGDPYGTSIGELCECATHSPASAEIDIVIDRVVD